MNSEYQTHPDPHKLAKNWSLSHIGCLSLNQNLDVALAGWSIVYVGGPQVIIYKWYHISISEDHSADPDEIVHHLGFRCFPNYPRKVTSLKRENKIAWPWG